MKIFSPSETNAPRASKEGEGIKKKGAGKKRAAEAPAEKKPVSESEIREKLAAHVETSNSAKSKTIQQNSKQMGAGFMNSEFKAPPTEIKQKEVGEDPAETKDSVKESHLLMSDVKLNDPKDPATQEKLKSVLSKGAFNFNPKEKETLDKILNGN
ncbi:MAG: hypothetical protein ACXVLQ_10310 [Bacteriovorax sp.]